MNRVALLRNSIESFLKVSLLAPPHLQAYVGVPLAFEQVVSQLLTPLEKMTFFMVDASIRHKNCNILHFLGIQKTPKAIIQNLASCTLLSLRKTCRGRRKGSREINHCSASYFILRHSRIRVSLPSAKALSKNN